MGTGAGKTKRAQNSVPSRDNALTISGKQELFLDYLQNVSFDFLEVHKLIAHARGLMNDLVEELNSEEFIELLDGAGRIVEGIEDGSWQQKTNHSYDSPKPKRARALIRELIAMRDTSDTLLRDSLMYKQ